MSETYPPEGDRSVGERPPETGELLPGVPQPPRKQELHWQFALLGFAAAGALSLGIAIGAGVVGNTTDVALSIIGPIASLVELAVFVGIIVAWILGRRNGNNRLRSFGIGGLIAYTSMMLYGLLAVGACFVSLGMGGGLFGN